MLALVLKTFLVYSFIGMRVHGDPLSDLKESYTKTLMECAKQYSISPGDIVQLQENIMPNNSNAKCMFACAYKATGMMDDKGMLSVDGVKRISEQYFADKPETVKNAYQFIDTCKTVNDQEVSDGETGCDRAALIFKCTVEQAPLFHFS